MEGDIMIKLNRPKGVKHDTHINVAKQFKDKNKRMLKKNNILIQKKETINGSYFDLHKEKYL